VKKLISLTVNGDPYEIAVSPRERLLDLIRERIGLTGTKEGCGEGECGACTVILNGRPVNACLVLAPQADGAEVLTIEGLARGDHVSLLQSKFVELGAVQCGFCSPGMIMTAKALLDQNPHPSEAEVRTALAGNLCRCTGYQKIVEAVMETARVTGADPQPERVAIAGGDR
jgi:aerobic carbon-monoxide dehydrogenase small subunit